MIVKFFNNRLHRILLNVPVKRYRNGGSCMLSLYEYIFTMINISISTKMNEVKLHKNDCMNKRIPDTELDYTHVILRIISLIISKGILNYTYTHIHTQNNLQVSYVDSCKDQDFLFVFPKEIFNAHGISHLQYYTNEFPRTFISNKRYNNFLYLDS